MKSTQKEIKKVQKPKVRIPMGSMSCCGDSVSEIIERLIKHLGFRIEDLNKTSIEINYDHCHYESDSPRICVEWGDID